MGSSEDDDSYQRVGESPRRPLHLISLAASTYGRGAGGGRGRAAGLGLAVGVARGVGVGVGVAVAVAVAVAVGVDVAVGAGVTVGVTWGTGAATTTAMGDPVLKKPIVAYQSVGGKTASNRKLYNVPKRIALAFGFCANVSLFHIRQGAGHS